MSHPSDILPDKAIDGSDVLKLREYQEEALGQLLLAGRAIYGDAAGSGKTPTTASFIGASGAIRTLVVAPSNKIIFQWERTIAEWAPWLKVVVVTTGTSVLKRQTAYSVVTNHDEAVLVIPYSILRQDQDFLVKMRFDTFVADESHHLKNRQSQVHKAAVKLARRAERAVLVTGTPLLNDAEEVWASMHLLAPTMFRSFWQWAHEHFWCVQKHYQGPGQPATTEVGDLKDGHDKILREQIGALLIKRPIETLLPDLPKVVHHEVPVELSAVERKHYDSMSKHGWMNVGGEVVFAPNEVTKMTRLRQLASDLSAFDADPEGNGLSIGSKVWGAYELISELAPEQVVVMVAYKATANALVDLFNSRDELEIAELHTGDQSHTERSRAVERFTTGQSRVIVGTHETMGEGVDGLQVASHIVLVDRDWTPARNEQAIARVSRSGQTADGVHAYYVVAADTIDQRVLETNLRKEAEIDLIIPTNAADALASSAGE